MALEGDGGAVGPRRIGLDHVHGSAVLGIMGKTVRCRYYGVGLVAQIGARCPGAHHAVNILDENGGGYQITGVKPPLTPQAVFSVSSEAAFPQTQ